MASRKDQHKNKLDDFDFCLRKAIAVHIIGEYIGQASTQTSFGNSMGVRQCVISKWINCKCDTINGKMTIDSTMSSRYVPSFLQLVKMAGIVGMTISEMIIKAVEKDKTNNTHLLNNDFAEQALSLAETLASNEKPVYTDPFLNEYRKKSPEHLQRIIKFEKATYLGFYLHQDKETKQFEINHLFLDTFEAAESGTVPVQIRIVGRSEHLYWGNIISPPNQDHLYIYMRQDGGKNDRGLMVFHYHEGDIRHGFRCGSGIMFSTERNLEKPHMHWIVLIRTNDNLKTLPESKEDNKNAVEMLRNRQIEAEETDRKDKTFFEVNNIAELDSIIKPILEEALPSPDKHYLIFDTLDIRQRTFHDGYYLNRIELKTFQRIE